ncbi:2-dehydropantoate 2-reductase N-terminal domain-containing protein [Actinomycetospora sp. NBRC 106378]|uniref:ketopantoate reductase family protein n=1 Tax=Actinomycetospora sp. NBRC 106378 TaxID=3032208 RepID=UPI0024A15414|nr:2-dehydropantoate 2-reductase N-terminal domain-containing protein [Actinomycetospora sp. NBRC 106378]GLZ55555.1 2-dehydropantoate 2-reductase [Actinomycetospora sp. NBRC 106378]
MRTLVLGAGATGGHLGALLLAAGRDVTFLVRPGVADRLSLEGLQVRGVDGTTRSHPVPSVVTAGELRSPYDLVVVAVRGRALADAVKDLAPAVSPGTQVVPLLNGMAHLDALVDAFGAGSVLGATARLAATLLPHGVIVEQAPGVTLELGRPGLLGEDLEAVRRELAVDGVTVRVVDDIRAAMWTKWLFIGASTVLTSLGGGPVGDVAAAPGGTDLVRTVVAELSAIAAAEGHGEDPDVLVRTFSDPTSRFVPSMTRELWAGRPVEVEVLDELAALARRGALASPLLDAARVRLRLGRATEPGR